MRILLLGAGYVGTFLASSWENSADRLIATTTSEEKITLLQAYPSVDDAVLLRVDESTDLRPLLDACDGLVITIAPNKGASYQQTYVATGKAVKRAVKGRGRPLYILYTSSTSVYGDQGGKQVTETSERIPISESSWALCETEDTLLSCASESVDVCVLRLGGIYGPGRTLEKRTERVSGKVLSGSGLEPTNSIHVKAIFRAIQHSVKNRLTGVFNLVEDDHPTRQELYTSIASRLGIPSPSWSGETASSTNAVVQNKKIKDAGFR